MEIRRAVAEDLDVVTDLRLAFLADHRWPDREEVLDWPDGFAEVTRDWLARLHSSGRMCSWLARVDGVDIGLTSVVLHDLPPRPEDTRSIDGRVLQVWVHVAHRRRGIGAALMRECLAAREELGARTFSLHATEDGRRLYERMGFVANDAWMERRDPSPLRSG